MDSAAQSLDSFVAACKNKGIAIAVITPTSPFIGVQLAEALLAQNLAVCCITRDVNLFLKVAPKIMHHPALFVFEQDSGELAKPKNTLLTHYLTIAEPKYIIYDLDQSLEAVPDGADLTAAISAQVEQLLSYCRSHQTITLLLSKLEYDQDNPFHHVANDDKAYTKQKHLRDIKLFVASLFSQAVTGSNVNARTIQYGEVYGPQSLDDTAPLQRMINAAIRREKIMLPGDGLTPHRPVYISDLMYGMIKSLFSDGTIGKIYTLVHPQEVTELVFAKTVQQVAASFGVFTDIVFTQAQATTSYAQRVIYQDTASKDLGWEPNVSLEEGLKATLRPAVTVPAEPTSMSPTQPTTFPNTPKPGITPHPLETIPTETATFLPGTAVAPTTASARLPQPKFSFLSRLKWPRLRSPSDKKHHALNPGLVLVILLLFVCLIALLFTPYVLLGIVQQATIRDLSNIAANQDDVKQLSNIQSEIVQAQKLESLALPANYLLHHKVARTQEQTSLSVLQYSVAGLSAYWQVTTMFNSSLHLGDKNLGTKMQDATLALKLAKENFALATAYQKRLQGQTIYSHVIDHVAILRQTASSQIASTQQAAQLTNALLGNTTDHTILLLLIDNNTLRPGGGTIAGVVLVAVTAGQSPTAQIFDHNDPRVSTIIPATPAYKNYFHQDTLSLPQALWEPHFDSAIAPFYNNLASVSPKPVQGIIGVDLNALAQLLTLTGPVTIQLPNDQSQSLTFSKDTFDQSILKLYGASSSDDSAKAITELTQKTIIQLLQSHAAFSTVSDAIKNLFAQQHLLFTTQDSSLKQEAIMLNSNQTTLPQDKDFLNIITLNLDDNKDDAYVKQTVHQDVVIGADNTIIERAVVTYRNESPVTTTPFGIYHGLSQVYIPANAKILRLTIDNKKPKALVEQDTILTKTVATPFTLNPNDTTTITLEYQRSLPLTFSNNKATITLEVLKQAGQATIPYELAIKAPPTLKLATTDQKFSQYADGVLLKTALDQTQVISETITKP